VSSFRIPSYSVTTQTVPPWPGATLSIVNEVWLTVVVCIGNGGIGGLLIWKTWYPVAPLTAPQSRDTRSLPMSWESVTRDLSFGGASGVIAVTVDVGLGDESVRDPSALRRTA